VGAVRASKPEYVKVDIRGKSRIGNSFGEITKLVAASEKKGLVLDYIPSNDGDMFEWGRRGPAVILWYKTPSDKNLRYAYSEITVPNGEDTIGAYYMANGFAQGYFGMQVNGPEERRVLFSVWSPVETDNPEEIPEDERVVLLEKGPNVQVSDFGNEGSGGQSYLVCPWVPDTTYWFLTEVTPDGSGNIICT